MAQIIVEGTVTERAKAQARSLEKNYNKPLTDSVFPMQEPDYFVHLWSVSKRPLRTEHALLGVVEVFPLEPGQRYRRVGIPIPDPFPQRVEDVFGTGRDPFDYHRGNAGAKRIAQDVCDPTNPTLDQNIQDYGKMDSYFAVQNGTNFANHGVFWSLNNPPVEEEIIRAEKRRDARMRWTIQQMDRIQNEDPKNATRLMGAAGFDDMDVRIALDHFGEERPYHRKFIPMAACPNCATQVPQTAAFHFLPNGACCVIDWKRTVDSGIKTKDDVPVEKRWWKGPGRPKDTSEET